MSKRFIINVVIILLVTFLPISVSYGEPIKGKDYYPYVYDYTSISFGKFNIVWRNIYNGKIPKGCELDFGENDMDNVVKVINLLNQITYVEKQPNPNIAFEYGGNCQAITLLAQAYLNNAGLSNDLYMEKDHMYNTVIIDGVLYKLDIVNEIFMELGGGNDVKFRKSK